MDGVDLRRHKLHNALHALLLVGGMVGLLVLLGYLLGGLGGVLWMGVFGLLFALFSPRLSPALILRLYGTRPLQASEVPGLYRMVQILSERAELPSPPALHYLPSPLMNAFSVGSRDDAAITVTDGLLRGLDSRSLLGVMAHEVAHVGNNDMWLMSLADTISRLVGGFSFIGQLLFLVNLPLFLMGAHMPWLPILLLVFAPTLSALLQLALSRNREFDADLDAARLTGDPLGLAQALERLEVQQERMFYHLLWPGRRNRQPSLLRTHPHSEERIERLRALAASPRYEEVPEVPVHAVPKEWVHLAHAPRRRWSGLWF